MSENSLQAKTFPMMTRRTFAASLGAAATLGASGKAAAEFTRSRTGHYAYVGAGDGATGVVHVVDLSKDGFKVIQTIASASPAHLELHPSRAMLYVVHDVSEWESLPRGAVSAYTIDAETGHLTWERTQTLALSAVNPAHARVTPDGSHLVVAVGGGGSYNVLPLDSRGFPSPVSGLFKEVGFATEEGERRISVPSSLAFHSDGQTLIAGDTGNESLSTFRLQAGGLVPVHRRRVHSGAGPSEIARHADSRFVYALNAVDGSISVHRIDASRAQTQASHQRIATDGAKTIAMHPSGRFLLTANGATITSWKIDRPTGRLQPTDPVKAAVTRIAFDRSGRSFLAADPSSGLVVRGGFSSANGAIEPLNEVGSLPFARSLLVL
jgi:6-phosphogluconolactonase